ncbi:MAG: molybdopterin molybdotransferase MoeA [Pseudomonadota bacterium]
MSELLALEEAQQKLLALAPQLPVETLPIEQVVGRYLSSDLIARRTQPPADLSAMDGYAIAGEGPWQRVGESRAGASFEGTLEPGQCTRISTGAHMPSGADRVLIQENAEVDGDCITATEPAVSGKHVRKLGFDFAEGDLILSTGTRIGAAQLALAISAGHGSVDTIRPPKVAILDSGDELVRDPALCGPDQIPASNAAMIAVMLRQQGCETIRLGPVPDDHDALAGALAEAESADLLVTSGGASVGDHDLIQEALRRWGADLAFWKVAIKPGKPLMVATRGSQVIVGLPGNPVSSFVTCFLFVLPLVRAAMGAREALPATTRIASAEALPAVGKRREFLRGVSDGDSVRLAASQDSSALLALASANCLIDRLPHAEPVRAGDPVRVFTIQNG